MNNDNLKPRLMKRPTNNLLTRQGNLTPEVTHSRVYSITERRILPTQSRRGDTTQSFTLQESCTNE